MEQTVTHSRQTIYTKSWTVSFENLFDRVIDLVHGLRANMKNKLMSMWDKIMLRKRYIIGCINDLLKNKANIVHSRHRSIHNFIMNICVAFTAYSFFENKGSACACGKFCTNAAFLKLGYSELTYLFRHPWLAYCYQLCQFTIHFLCNDNTYIARWIYSSCVQILLILQDYSNGKVDIVDGLPYHAPQQLFAILMESIHTRANIFY